MLLKKLIILYGITILWIGTGCHSNLVENQFKKFLDTHVKTVEPLIKEINEQYWQATVSGQSGDYHHHIKLELKLRKIYSNTAELQQLAIWKNSGKVKAPLLSRQLELLYFTYLNNQIDQSLLDKIVKLGMKVENEFNIFRATIDNEPISDTEINRILRKETDSQLRQKAWEASKQIAIKVVDDLIELIKLRNQAAQTLGFDNYFMMALTLSEQNDNEIATLFTQLRQMTDEPFRQAKAELDSILADSYGIGVAGLRPWHYHDPFFQESPVLSEIHLDRYYEDQDIKELARQFFRGIGLPVDDILANSDLYEKEGKNPGAFCLSVDRNHDIRILGNLQNNETWMKTLLHELGHGVYNKFIDQDLPFLLRKPAHTFITEAVALFFGRLSGNVNWLKEMNLFKQGNPGEIATMVKTDSRLQQLIFAQWCLVMFNFERELYKNPDQDLNTLWWDLVKEYQLVMRPPGRNQPDWAAKIHFAIAPAYYHNYLLAEMFASQLHYNLLQNLKLNPDDASFGNNENVGTWFRHHLLRVGNRYRWQELIERATGEPLTPYYFVQQLVQH